MVAPISVIIPTLNAAQALPGAAAALFEGVQDGLIRELIVSDGRSTDDTPAVAEELGAQIVTGAASRGGQLQRGCDVARGAWLLVVHADTQLAPGWTQAARAHMADHPHMAGYGQLRFDAGGRPVAAWANLRSRLFGLPYGDQGLLLPATLYARVGGYPDQPLMEDVALARRLRRALCPAGFVAVTSAVRYRREGWIRRGARNLWTLLRYFAGVSPARLAARYSRPS